jgi:DNA-binding GntR family transcriptional regulator
MGRKSPQSTVKKSTGSVRESTYAYLKERLLSGRLEPGERLTEEHLASEFGVSRTPVREALHKLEREGLVKPLETRGFCVALNSREEMEELFDIRSILEGYALRCASEMISEENVAELEGIIQRAEEALEQGEIDGIFHLNTAFHDTLHNIVSHRSRLCTMMADMRKYVLRYRKDTLHTVKGAKRTIQGHRKIMLALRLKDPDLCERIMRAHIQEAKEDALNSVRPEMR